MGDEKKEDRKRPSFQDHGTETSILKMLLLSIDKKDSEQDSEQK